jgi:hypothetical protein
MVMPFGLTNTPATFDWLINDILFPLLGHIVTIYLHDILVFNKNWEEHLQHVCNVLQLFCTNHLHFKELKSSFGLTFVSNFGLAINQEGVCPDASKFHGITQ